MMRCRRPAYRRKHAQGDYAKRDAKPQVRQWLLAVRLSKDEVTEFRAMCQAHKTKPSVQMRTLIRRFAGIK